MKKKHGFLMIILICVITIAPFTPRTACHDRPHGSDDAEWFVKLVKYHDFTYENYYCEVEYGIDKKIDFFRKYQNLSTWTKHKLYELLMFRGYIDDNGEIFNLAVELAKDGDFEAQIDLANAYKKGWFIENNVTITEYLSKISKCNEKDINIEECEIDK
jgi:hypothetical protein